MATTFELGTPRLPVGKLVWFYTNGQHWAIDETGFVVIAEPPYVRPCAQPGFFKRLVSLITKHG